VRGSVQPFDSAQDKRSAFSIQQKARRSAFSRARFGFARVRLRGLRPTRATQQLHVPVFFMIHSVMSDSTCSSIVISIVRYSAIDPIVAGWKRWFMFL